MYINIPEDQLNNILDINNTTLIDYYKKMRNESNIIVDNKEILIFDSLSKDSQKFFCGNTNWCTNENAHFLKYRNDLYALLIRIVFPDGETFKYTKFLYQKKYGRSSFADKRGNYYDDIEFENKFTNYTKQIKKYLPIIDKYVKKKSEIWFNNVGQNIFNLYLNYSLKLDKYKIRIANRLVNYKKITVDIINGLSMMMYCNDENSFNDMLNIALELDMFKVMDLIVLVTKYNDRLSKYTKDDLRFDIAEFNQKYS